MGPYSPVAGADTLISSYPQDSRPPRTALRAEFAAQANVALASNAGNTIGMIIRRAESQRDFDAVSNLMRAFVEWHYERHSADRHIVDSYFNPAKFEAELEGLPGEFSPPAGALLIAEEDERIAGCVALRPLGESICEMKRMFVSAEFHGKGVGLLLGQAVVEEARRIGYRRMMLDTGPAQREAQGLYRKLGFTTVEPYYELPLQLRDWLVFMELDLA